MSAHLSEHPSEWTLRRLHAGELPTPEATRARTHAAECEQCGAVLRAAEEAQRQFEAATPFERFEEGVKRAEEKSRKEELARRGSAQRWMGPVVALAATVLLVVAVRPLLATSTGSGVRTKGGAVAELRIGGGEGTQRMARTNTPEPLAPGERVRIGYTPDTRRYVLALSIDSAGEVTPLYPETGESLPVKPGAGTHWLPDSIEFTGSGAERVVVLLSDAPVKVEDATAAAREAFEAVGRDVAKLPPLSVDGDQTHWMLLKP
ncbi:DUF4384 domain-containing protein [Hyalangium minutum]|uniref:Uncharacterized protein n=1 Tax=Hyalangium minutum TaxID=394096 RepID=A0A085WHE9_9BACT|nr:DUF4384 domain-containing protein [Hyalangium minutum]KFE67112.1 hypothetical protein DB31_8465 [Hyalangium minutum]